jgi:GGDEF domain-containing protein
VLLAYPVIDLVLAIARAGHAAHARSDMRRVPARRGGRAAPGGHRRQRQPPLAVARRSEGFEWHNVVLQAGLALLLVAAMLPTATGAADDSQAGVRVDAALPHVPVLLALAVVAVHVVTGHTLDAASVLLGAVVLAGVVVRQTLYAQHLVAVARRLSVEATHDPLTELFNRRACLRGADTALAERRAGEVALVLLDLDGFKEVNDTFGHACRDVALRAVADRLRSVPDATAARLGGDEFALLLVGPGRPGAGRRRPPSPSRAAAPRRSARSASRSARARASR